MSQVHPRVILIGPSGSGKSELAHRLASALGFTAVDTDAEIVERIGMPISTFFERFGEPAFRAIESGVIASVCQKDRIVVAAGGGAVLESRNWDAWRAGSVIIALIASPATLVRRVTEHIEREGQSAERPLLAGDAQRRIEQLLAERARLYQMADATINTDAKGPEAVCDEALAIIHAAVDSHVVPSLRLAGANRHSDIFIRRGAADHLDSIVRRRWPATGTTWMVTDENLISIAETRFLTPLVETTSRVRMLTVPAGESSKSMGQVERLCEVMTSSGVRRNDVVVALGGGVIGDLAGFVASICLRGLNLVQVPTSLLAMVDSSIGGKTGVNMPAGKNLVGTFYQPDLVVIDPGFLATLPRQDYRAGMAEVIKHALIQPSTPLGGDDLIALLEKIDLDPVPDDHVERVLELNVAIKHSVVQADERESGLRMLLNFGHTAGHAIEANGYQYRHGEAVAIGMVVASRVAQNLGRVDDAYVKRVEGMLDRARLPKRFDGEADRVIGGIESDKKNVAGSLNWILPASSGGVDRVTGVPIDIVRQALVEVGAH